MLLLDRRCRSMPHRHGTALDGRWIMANSIRSTIKRNAPFVPDRVLANYCLVNVRVVNDRRVHTHNCGVIGESSTAPLAPGKSDTHVAIAVIDAAVVPDLIAPVAVMKAIVAAFPAPPRRSPEGSLIWSRNPCPGYPVIAVITPGPVPWRPHPSLFRTRRLLIDRKLRRSNGHRNRKLCGRDSRHKSKQESRQQPAHVFNETHWRSSSDPRLSSKYSISNDKRVRPARPRVR